MKDASYTPADMRALMHAMSERPIVVFPVYVRITGSHAAAIFLAQLRYWSEWAQGADRDGWFYKTGEEWEQETGLRRTQRDSARLRLRDLGILEEGYRSPDPRDRTLHYRIDLDALARYVLDSSPVNPDEKATNATAEKQHMEAYKSNTSRGMKPAHDQYAESTTEITTEKDTPKSPKSRSPEETKARARNPEWDALTEGVGLAPKTASERAQVAKAAKELREAEVSPTDILRACGHARKTWPADRVTWGSIARNISKLLAEPSATKPARAYDPYAGKVVY